MGRCTGYDDNKQTIIFTNIDSIIKYYRLWESGFDDRTIKWNSKTTTYRRGELRVNKTFNDPELYQGFDVQPSVFEPQIKKFNTAQEAINFYKTDLKTIFRGLGPRGKYEMTEDVFFLGRYRHNLKICSCEEVYEERKIEINRHHTKFKLIPCYRDINDNLTLQWWLIYLL